MSCVTAVTVLYGFNPIEIGTVHLNQKNPQAYLSSAGKLGLEE